MTQRRRFFPSTPVQTVPGQTVELEMRLRAQAPAPAAAAAPVAPPTTDSGCTGWLVPVLCAASPDVLEVEALTETRTNIYGNYYDPETDIDYGALVSSVWEGLPPALDGLGRARPVPGVGFLCVELDIETTSYKPFPGRDFMALLPGGAWVAEWDSATGDPLVAASGHLAVVVGGTLAVVVQSTDTGMDLVETLTARAFSGATQIAELILRTRRIAG